MNRQFIRIAALAAIFVLAACSQPPQPAIDAARQALDAARTANAAKWAPTEWDSAQAAQAALQTELTAQEGKLPLFRKYSRAAELAAAAETSAATATTAAADYRQQAQDEAQAALELARESLASARSVLTHLQGCGSRAKGFAADLTLLSGNLDGMSSELGNVEASFQTEDFSGASSGAEALWQRLKAVEADMRNAGVKIRCEPPRSPSV